MAHPIIEEFCRAGELRPGMLRRFQRDFRETIQALLNERDTLLTENDALKAEIATLKAPRAQKKGAADAVPA